MTFSRNILFSLVVELSDTLLDTYSNNDRPGMNNSILANANASKDEAVGSNVHISADVDFRGDRGAIRTTALGTSRVRGGFDRVNSYVRTDGRVVANGNFPRIQELAIHPDGYIAANVDVVAIVAVEGCLNDNWLTQMAGRSVAMK